MVLNESSTHPNPWRPPTQVEGAIGVYQPYKIYRGGIQEFTVNAPIPTRYVDGPFTKRLFYSIKDGLAMGLFHSIFDIYLITLPSTPKAIISRAVFLTSPLVAASVGYAATREFFTNFSTKKDSFGPTAGASIVAGSILGVAHKSVRVGYYSVGVIAAYTGITIAFSRFGITPFGVIERTEQAKHEVPVNYFYWNKDEPFFSWFNGNNKNSFYPDEDVPRWKKFEKDQED